MSDLVERPVTIDIVIAWHKKQAEHFGPFGAHNALTVFHSGAADEIERLRADAERYRWLRGNVPQHSARWPRWRVECFNGQWNDMRGDVLDEAIDGQRNYEAVKAAT